MKTTIEIADDLISRAKIVQKRDEVTLRALVEEGLRLVLDRHVTTAKYSFKPVVVGKPYQPGMDVPDIRELLAEANERPWSAREFPRAGRVAEPKPAYAPAKKRVTGKKRKP